MLAERHFRDILGRFPTGVVLITAVNEGEPVGMTVNSFTSVSLNPPLIALCASYTSTTWPAIRSAGSFAVTILGEQHEGLCRRFSTRHVPRFSGWEWVSTCAGHPVPADGLAWLDCRIATVQPAGDHELVLAAALDGSITSTRPPLVFHTGRFIALATKMPE